MQNAAGPGGMYDITRSRMQDMMYQQMRQLASAMDVKKPAKKTLPEEELVCATGGIVAWRSWRLPGFAKQILSINGKEWPVREPLEAACNNGPTSCLGNHCACGIYGWKERKSLKVNESEYSCLDGEVWLWGRVIEHELGYRAEFAYPKAFVNSGGLAKKLAAIYGAKLIEG